MTKEVPRTSVLRDEELNKTLIVRLRDGCNLQQKDGERAADRIELLATTNEQLVATNEALSISNATLIAERDAALEWLSASQGYIADAVYALGKQEAAEAKLAKAVEALGKLCGLAPVERPPEPYDEYGWQTADTAERHAQMVLGRDLWAVADFARAALARVKGVM